METWVYVIIWGLVIGGAIAYYFVKRNKNKEAALSGEDKEKVLRAAEQLFGEDAGLKTLYAHHEKTEHYGRTTKTTYFRYLVAYKDDALYIAPLGIDKKTRQIQAGRPYVYNVDALGKVIVSTGKKNDAVNHIDVNLCGKEGDTLFQFSAEAENLRKNRWFPVNIYQHEECADFADYINDLSRRVAEDNPGVDEIIKAKSIAGVGLAGAILSGIGTFLTFLFPPAGVVAALIGLILAVVSKAKGTLTKKYLIISLIFFAVSAVVSAMYMWTMYGA